MNTCQTSINTNILIIWYLYPMIGEDARHYIQLVPSELIEEGKVKRTNTDLLNTYRRSKLWKL